MQRRASATPEQLLANQGRIPPQAVDLEEVVLGALMLEKEAVNEVIDILTPEAFYREAHQKIFKAIKDLFGKSEPIDILTVTNELKLTGELESVGGAYYISKLTNRVVSAANVEYHARIIMQKHIQRELIAISSETINQAFEDTTDVFDLLDNAENRLFQVSENNLRRSYNSMQDLVGRAITEIQNAKNSDQKLRGVPSGYTELDRITQGWQKSDLIILAARPSVGKTAFALNLARNAAVDHHFPVAVFSLEMSAVQLAKRIMTSESGLSADKIKGGVKLEPYEWEQLEYKLKNLSKAPLYIDDTPSLPVMEFRTKAKSLVNHKGVRLIIVDYLQLMQAPADYRGMREQEVAFISRTLKATAKDLNVPIIALSQLSRASVTRAGATGKPQLSDLRESGSIEQDADMVLFIHRPDYVGLSENLEDREKTQIIIAKHRNGETKEIDMRFRGDQIRFIELNDSLVSEDDSRSVSSAMNDDYDGDFGGFPASDFEN
jgi:replicative DNA helicase